MPMLNMSSSPRRLRTAVLSLLSAFILSACGGGGDNRPGGVPGINSSQPVADTGGAAPVPVPAPVPAPAPAPQATLSLALTDPSGAATTALSASKLLTATALLKDAAGKPVENALVAFSADPALALLAPASGTALTDSTGKASVTLSAPSLQAAGAGLVKVAAALGEQALLAQAPFSLGATSVSLRVLSPAASPAMLQAYGSGVITVDVLANGVLLGDEPQSISLGSLCASAGKAILPSEVITVGGRAQVVYRDQGCAQTDTVTMSIPGAGAGATAKAVFQISAPDAASITVGAIAPSDRSIVIKGSGGNGRSESASVQFRVVDQFGKPLANQAVAFATISTRPVTLSKTSDMTDAMGQVYTTVNAGSEPTAVRVQASLPNGLSTISDGITVTTGVPAARAFSLSSESFNIEGWNFDNVQTGLQLLLADQFGNPVADGTPVVFQTDSGAVGSSERGGCTTLNGVCSVTLRSQNPRYASDASAPQGRAGLATISVSTSDNTSVPLTGKIAVFFSAGSASRITRVRNGVSTPVGAAGVALSASDCNPVQLQIRLNDLNNNPLPSGTALDTVNATALSAAILPAVVPSVAPGYVNGVVSGEQGSTHLIAVTPDAATCVAGGARRASAAGTVTVTTPKGIVTSFPLTLTYPALP